MNSEGEWEAVITNFNELGILLYNEEFNLLCLKPTFLSKMMALFIAPEQHIQRLQSDSDVHETNLRSAIVGYTSAINRISSLKEISGYSSTKFIYLFDNGRRGV